MALKVLITGSSGFVGSHAVDLLSDKHDVIGVDMKIPDKYNPHAVFYRDNLLTMEQTGRVHSLLAHEQPDVVLHLAAQARVEPSFNDPIFTYRTNVEGTINLLKACLDYSPKTRFVYASSEIIYGNADRYPTKEFYHYRPDSPYAASKAAADMMVQNCTGLKTVVLRSGMGYGPRSPPIQIVTKFFLKAMKGEGLVFPDGPVRHPTRDVNYILNFVGGIARLLDHPEVTGVYNMGSGEEVDMLTLAEKIVHVAGRGEIRFSGHFQYRPGEEGKRTWLDNTKAEKDFGYDPKIRLDEGLRLTYKWLQEHPGYFS